MPSSLHRPSRPPLIDLECLPSSHPIIPSLFHRFSLRVITPPSRSIITLSNATAHHHPALITPPSLSFYHPSIVSNREPSPHPLSQSLLFDSHCHPSPCPLILFSCYRFSLPSMAPPSHSIMYRFALHAVTLPSHSIITLSILISCHHAALSFHHHSLFIRSYPSLYSFISL